MTDGRSIKQKIIGGFELFFLFGRGMENFSGTRAAALRSLAIPAATFIYGLIFHAIWPYPPKGMEAGYDYWQVTRTVTAHFLLALFLSSGFTYLVAWAFAKREKFWLLFEASNWVGVTGFLVGLPLSLLATFALAPREAMDRVFVILTLYGVLVTACIIRAGLRVNWQLAAGIALGGFCIDNELWHILFAMQGIPIPW